MYSWLNMIRSQQKIKELKNYTIIDVETTGFSPEKDYLIEIAALKIENNQIIKEFNEIVYNSFYEKLEDFQTVDFHGLIKKSETIGSKQIDEIIEELKEFVGNDVIIGHNVGFDLKFINYYSNEYFSSFKKIDTVTLSRKLLPNLENHKLETLKKHYKIETISHRGLDDCKMTHILFENLKQLIQNQNIEKEELNVDEKIKKLKRQNYALNRKIDNLNEDSKQYQKLEEIIEKNEMEICALELEKNEDFEITNIKFNKNKCEKNQIIQINEKSIWHYAFGFYHFKKYKEEKNILFLIISIILFLYSITIVGLIFTYPIGSYVKKQKEKRD